jgi:hypothetical protein
MPTEHTHARNYRVQLFVNDFIIFYVTESIDKYIFTQSFFYSTAQTGGEKVVHEPQPQLPSVCLKSSGVQSIMY